LNYDWAEGQLPFALVLSSSLVGCGLVVDDVPFSVPVGLGMESDPNASSGLPPGAVMDDSRNDPSKPNLVEAPIPPNQLLLKGIVPQVSRAEIEEVRCRSRKNPPSVSQCADLRLLCI
jgi:hypothetical protein